MTQENLALFTKLAACLSDIVADSGQHRAFIELTDRDGIPSITFIIRGQANCDAVRPALDRLCPNRVIREGSPVEKSEE